MTVYENIAFGLDVRKNHYFTTPVSNKNRHFNKKRIKKTTNVFFFQDHFEKLSFSLGLQSKKQKKFCNGLLIHLHNKNTSKKKFKIV